MALNGYGDEVHERVVDETLDLIDDLDLDQARSILRCFTIDEENFDRRALVAIMNTVRATRDRSQSDYDALVHFPDCRVAKLNREHLLKSQAIAAEAERIAQQAVEDAQRSTHSSQAPAIVPDIDNNEDGSYDQHHGTEASTSIPDLGDPGFENVETRRFMSGANVTINHYYMNKGTDVQTEPKAEPQAQPKEQPMKQPKAEPELKRKRCPKPEPMPNWLLCALCEDWYLEADNVLQEDGRPPCGYHTGQIVNYGNNEYRALQNYGIRMTGRAWNCCRRSPQAAGCHPEFHEQAE
ncbi:hypothetical protein J7T55_003771 [Diaporthe amygdali]|uniref:uncharacterized protein n=1 Tax=Phomopsis amygdali TaxID=1214568 RepID=UPI0022FEE855|nr:uncharacterized protein J7T55_003771 [Diaporthe amygdali]KAJ0117357.1 hypothetical protein J7T55_003771 [Diaporthe amygdali]